MELGQPWTRALARVREAGLALATGSRAEGARAIPDVDAWLAAQEIRAPARLARVYMPEVT